MYVGYFKNCLIADVLIAVGTLELQVNFQMLKERKGREREREKESVCELECVRERVRERGIFIVKHILKNK